tara:strand:- start:129 stop:2147 length:2019 start_codon:yes stop_codon:yes gene_type:complete
MAGFAIDLGSAGSEFAQGVAAPSATETGAAAAGLTNLTNSLFGAVDDFQKIQARNAPTQAEVNNAAFGSFVNSAMELRGIKDPATLAAKANSLAIAYGQQGYDIGAAERDAVLRIAGYDLTAYTIDPVQVAAQQANQKLVENPGYLYLAEQKLIAGGKRNYSSQDIASQALSDMMASEAAATFLVSSQNISQADFTTTYIPAANKVLSDIRGLALAGLRIEIGGGDIAPKDIVNLRTKYDVAIANLTKPANITSEQWQAVGSQITTLDTLLTRLETYDASMLTAQTAEAMESISQLLVQQARELGETDPILARAMLSDKIDWSPYVAQRWPEVLKTLTGMKIKDTVYTPIDVFGFDAAAKLNQTEILNDMKIDGAGSTNTMLLNTQEMFDIAVLRTPVERRDAINNALDFKVRLNAPLDVNLPEHRDNFLNGIGQATLNVATSKQLLAPETFDSLFSQDVITKLSIIKANDPERHATAVAQMKDAVMAQANIHNTTATGALADSYFALNALGEIEYDLDKKFLDGQVRNMELVPLVENAARTYYNNDIAAMIRDRGSRINSMERSAIESTGFKFVNAMSELNTVRLYADGQKKYVSLLKKLGVDTTNMEAMLIKPVDTDTPNTPDGSTATLAFTMMATTPEDAKIEFNNYPIGAWVINPANGVAQKKSRDIE